MFRTKQTIASTALGDGTASSSTFLRGDRTWTASQATSSGNYTPTLTNVANLDSSTAYTTAWSRVGNVVTVAGKVLIDPTAGGGTTTTLGISLPVASALAVDTDLAGSGAATGVQLAAGIYADAANDRAQMQFASPTTAQQTVYFVFCYTVI